MRRYIVYLTMAFSFISSINSQMTIDWSLTFRNSDLGIPTDLKFDKNGSFVCSQQGGVIFVMTFWNAPVFTNSKTVCFLINESGKLLGKKIGGYGDQYAPVHLSPDYAVLQKNAKVKTFVTWTFDDLTNIREELFPYQADILQGNTSRGDLRNDPMELNTSLLAFQFGDDNFVIRKLGWQSTSPQSKVSIINESNGKVIISTETKKGKDYRLQASEDLILWKDENIIKGDGSTKSVSRTTDKPKEFLRVFEE